jgi:hypothetical protein
VRILGDGQLEKKLTVEAHAFSKGARQRIEQAGGTARVIERQTPAEKARAKRGRGGPKPAAPAPAKPKLPPASEPAGPAAEGPEASEASEQKES